MHDWISNVLEDRCPKGQNIVGENKCNNETYTYEGIQYTRDGREMADDGLLELSIERSSFADGDGLEKLRGVVVSCEDTIYLLP